MTGDRDPDLLVGVNGAANKLYLNGTEVASGTNTTCNVTR